MRVAIPSLLTPVVSGRNSVSLSTGKPNFASSLRRRARPLGCPARKRGDSGNAKRRSPLRSRGSTPAIAIRTRHEKNGRICAAITPPSTPPRGMQTMVAAITEVRRRSGVVSAINAVAFGRAAPMPSPETSLQKNSIPRECDVASKRVERPNHRTAAMIARLRPNLSPMNPPTKVPAATASRLIAKISAKLDFSRFHSCDMAGTAKPSIGCRGHPK